MGRSGMAWEPPLALCPFRHLWAAHLGTKSPPDWAARPWAGSALRSPQELGASRTQRDP